ncbi:MAG: hypothetical protein ACRCTR_09950 [Actinomycetota bacterium]
MRLHDLVHRHLDGANSVTEFNAGDETEKVLRLPPSVSYQRGNLTDPKCFAATTLSLLKLGTNPEPAPEIDALGAALASAQVNATVIFLLSWSYQDLPANHLLPALISHSFQIREIHSLASPLARSGLVAQRVDDLQPLNSYLGKYDGAPIDQLKSQLRLVNEYLVADFYIRSLRDQSKADLKKPVAATSNPKIKQLENRIVLLEESTTMRAGRALVAAAKQPVRGIYQLPRDLIKLKRRSSS